MLASHHAMPSIRRPAVLLRAAVAAALVLLSGQGLAADPVRVAVIHVRDDEPSRRVRAELGAAGLQAVDTPVRAGDARTAAAVARDESAVAAVRVVSAEEAELAIIDSDSGRVLYEKTIRSSGAQNDPLALRAVED